jgi:hypothetical protein
MHGIDRRETHRQQLAGGALQEADGLMRLDAVKQNVPSRQRIERAYEKRWSALSRVR